MQKKGFTAKEQYVANFLVIKEACQKYKPGIKSFFSFTQKLIQ